MPPEIPSTAPATIMQGDTLRWRVTSVDATPATATIAVRVASSAHSVEVSGIADGDGWLVTVAAEQTRRLGAGLLKYLVRATYAGGIVQTLTAGSITAVGVSELGTGAATMSHAARMVALLEAQLEKLAADSLAEYSIGERTAKRRAMAEVETSLSKARRALAMEQNGGRLPSVHMVFPPLVGIDTSSVGRVG
jgi:hypothetical protein